MPDMALSPEATEVNEDGSCSGVAGKMGNDVQSSMGTQEGKDQFCLRALGKLLRQELSWASSDHKVFNRWRPGTLAEGVRTLSRVFGELWARRLDAWGRVEKVERMLGKGVGAGMEKCLEGQAKAFGFGPAGNRSHNCSYRVAHSRASVNDGWINGLISDCRKWTEVLKGGGVGIEAGKPVRLRGSCPAERRVMRLGPSADSRWEMKHRCFQMTQRKKIQSWWNCCRESPSTWLKPIRNAVVLEADKSQLKEKRLTKPECLRAPWKEDAEPGIYKAFLFEGRLVTLLCQLLIFSPHFTIFSIEVIHLVRHAKHLPNQAAGRIRGNRSPRPLLVGVLTHRL